MLFHQNTRKTENNAVERCSGTWHSSIHGSKPVIQNWETDALQFYLMALIFLLAVMVEGDEST